jgi:hypothetical protein
MKTNFQMLRELLEKYHPMERGMVKFAESMLIRETLHVEEMDILQLRNLRDFTVSHMGRSDNMEDWDRMSAITYCIDSRIVELGGEV